MTLNHCSSPPSPAAVVYWTFPTWFCYPPNSLTSPDIVQAPWGHHISQLWPRENSGFIKCFAYNRISPCLWAALWFLIQTILWTAEATEMPLDGLLMLSCPLPWRLGVEQGIWFLCRFFSSCGFHKPHGRLQVLSDQQAEDLSSYSTYSVVPFGVPIARGLFGCSWKPRAMAETDWIIGRSFYSLQLERAGTNLVPGRRALQRDVLVLLSLN